MVYISIPFFHKGVNPKKDVRWSRCELHSDVFVLVDHHAQMLGRLNGGPVADQFGLYSEKNRVLGSLEKGIDHFFSRIGRMGLDKTAWPFCETACYVYTPIERQGVCGEIAVDQRIGADHSERLLAMDVC